MKLRGSKILADAGDLSRACWRLVSTDRNTSRPAVYNCGDIVWSVPSSFFIGLANPLFCPHDLHLEGGALLHRWGRPTRYSSPYGCDRLERAANGIDSARVQNRLDGIPERRRALKPFAMRMRICEAFVEELLICISTRHEADHFQRMRRPSSEEGEALKRGIRTADFDWSVPANRFHEVDALRIGHCDASDNKASTGTPVSLLIRIANCNDGVAWRSLILVIIDRSHFTNSASLASVFPGASRYSERVSMRANVNVMNVNVKHYCE